MAFSPCSPASIHHGFPAAGTGGRSPAGRRCLLVLGGAVPSGSHPAPPPPRATGNRNRGNRMLIMRRTICLRSQLLVRDGFRIKSYLRDYAAYEEEISPSITGHGCAPGNLLASDACFCLHKAGVLCGKGHAACSANTQGKVWGELCLGRAHQEGSERSELLSVQVLGTACTHGPTGGVRDLVGSVGSWGHRGVVLLGFAAVGRLSAIQMLLAVQDHAGCSSVSGNVMHPCPLPRQPPSRSWPRACTRQFAPVTFVCSHFHAFQKLLLYTALWVACREGL